MATHEVRVWRNVKVHLAYKVEAETEEDAIQQVVDFHDDENVLEHRPDEMIRELGEFDWDTIEIPKKKPTYLTA